MARPQAKATITVVVNETKPAFFNHFAAIFAATGSFVYGYDSGIISSVISTNYAQFHSYFQNPGPGALGAIVAVLGGGAFFGALVAGQTADWIGRKRTIQLGAFVAVVGCAIQTGSINVAMLIVGRAICGFSVGILTMIVPIYQAEISPPHSRGLLSGWTQLMICWGFFLANWVGYGSQYYNDTRQFRVPLGIQIIPAAILLLGMFFLPFSPRWLAKRGRVDEARQVLLRLHGGRKEDRAEVVEAEILYMVTQVEWERDNLSTSYCDLIKTKPNLHRTFCGCLIQAMCQWTGVTVTKVYGPTIYHALGFGGHTTLLINSLQSAWGLIVTWVFITFIVDRIGRRRPLIFGCFLCAVAMAWQAGANASFSKDPSHKSSGIGIAGVAAVFFFSLAFYTSIGTISWIYQAEVFPMNIRALGASVSIACNWLNDVIIAQVTPYGFKHLGYKYFIVYVCTCVSNTIICFYLFPETKNKTLEEIGLLFGDTKVMIAPTEVPSVERYHGQGEIDCGVPDGDEKV